ncbi:MAG: hypothetical protein ACOCW2_04635 [Chitinivibrionales bacterium]
MIDKTFSIITSVALIAAVHLYAQNDAGEVFERADTDTSTFLDRPEFCTAMQQQGGFDSWDSNNDSRISASEFATRAVSIWDDDRDGTIGRFEWEQYSSTWFDNGYDFASWDTDQSLRLTQTEFETGLIKSGFFIKWDQNRDNMLTQNEFCSFAWSVADEDQDEQVTRDEWTMFWSDKE